MLLLSWENMRKLEQAIGEVKYAYMFHGSEARANQNGFC